MKVASAREESEGLTPQVHSSTTAQDTQTAPASVLMQNADFQTMSLRHWQSVLRVPEYCKSLSTYCVLCGQWASCTGFKQHIRLSHESTHAVHRRAVARCTQLGLAAVSPCRYCGTVVKQPAKHLAACPAVYQASLVQLLLQPTSQVPSVHVSDGRGRERQGSGCSAGDGAFGAQQYAEPSRADAGQSGRLAEVGGSAAVQKLGCGRAEQVAQGRVKRHGPLLYGGWGPKRKTPEQEEKEKALDRETQQLLQLMTRMTLRHEKELSRLRVDTSFVMFCDVGDHGCLPQMKATAENWQEQCAAQKVTTSLKVIMMPSLLKALRNKMEQVTIDQEITEKCKTLAWLSEGANALAPCWNYLEWNSTEKRNRLPQFLQSNIRRC